MLALRPMTLLEIVDASFRLYRNNFWLLFGTVAVAYVPLQAISNSLPLLLAKGPAEPVFVAGIAAALTIPLLAAAALLSQAAVTKAAVSRYLQEPETIGSAWGFILRKCVAYALTLLVAGLLVMAGFILLIVPGIIFAFWIYFVNQVFVVEGLRSSQAIGRSRRLMAGYWGKAFIVGLVGAATSWVIAGVASIPSVALAGPEPGIGMALSGLLQGIGNAFVQPIPLLISVLLYFDSRIRKEGFDLEMLARQLGRTIQAQQPPQATA